MKKKRTIRKFLIIGISLFLIQSFLSPLQKEFSNQVTASEEKQINRQVSLNNNKLELDEKLSTKEKLQILSNYDQRINKIIEHYDLYPELLLEMLTRNLEMLDFVVDYPRNYGIIYENKIDNLSKGTIPLLLQWDKRWGYGKYGESSIAISGCGPTALSMVIAGLTGNTAMTPSKIASFSEENGYYVNGVGTSWELMTTGARKLGIKSKEVSLSKKAVLNALKKNHPIICSMRKGDFTTTGHFIVLIGIKDGKIQVNDPNSRERSATLWTYERLEPQIKNLWEFSN